MQAGDKVEWTHVSSNGRSLSMTLREGTIEQIKGDVAVVRTKGRRLVEVAVRRLRSEGQESQISEFVGAMRENARRQPE